VLTLLEKENIMITDKEVLEAVGYLCETMSTLTREQSKALLVIVRHLKHQHLRKEREANGLGHLNREEDVVQSLKDKGLA
jgi:hypothetical protein